MSPFFALPLAALFFGEYRTALPRETPSCPVRVTNTPLARHLLDVKTYSARPVKELFTVAFTAAPYPSAITYPGAAPYRLAFGRSAVYATLRTGPGGQRYLTGWEKADIRDPGIKLRGGIHVGMSRAAFLQAIGGVRTECNTIVLVDEDQSFAHTFFFKENRLVSIGMRVTL